MEEPANKERREEIFSRAIRAGKRTYFFDVKATRAEEQYLTITESKRRFNNEQGKFFYEKHKIFLYKEDFDKFKNGLTEVLDFIQKGVAPVEKVVEETISVDKPVQVEFEDLTSDTEKEEVESAEKVDD